MAFQVTQCPSCESTFNTNPSLLDMADGKVRCGACLTVFLAEENFIDSNVAENEDEQESVFIGRQPADFFDPSQFLTRSALNEELREPREALIPQAVDEEFESVAAPAPEESLHVAVEPESRDAETESDESLEFFSAIDESLQQFEEADDITDLQEIASLEPHGNEDHDAFDSFISDEDKPKTTPEQFGLSASFSLQFQTGSNKPEDMAPPPDHAEAIVDPSEFPDEEPTDAKQADTDNLESIVRQAIEEQDFSAAIAAGLREETEDRSELEQGEQGEFEEEEQEELGREEEEQEELGREEEEEPAREDEEEGEEESEQNVPEVDMSTEAIRARALQQELEDEEALEQIPRENLSTLRKIAAPVQLTGGRQRSFGKSLAMLALILLLGTTLAGQYLWRHKDTYSLDPRFRSAYLFVCGQLSCQLPDYTAIDSIRSDNLAVRSHPEREDGLMVTVEIRNTAAYPQRFPILILGFNSASNQVIALREFAPGEYLDEGLQQFEFMPVASPVQVALPIMDPGSDALNYTLAFRSP